MGRWVSMGLVAGLLFAFWLALSGHYETKFLLLGTLSVVVVLALNRDVFHHQSASRIKGALRMMPVTCWRWLAYLTWLLYSIVVANLQVAYLVLHPRMPITPVLLRFKTPRFGDVAQVVLANSITITPGTVTVDLRDGQYTVHTLSPSLSRGLSSGETLKRVASLFREEIDETLAVTCIQTVGALEP